MPLSQFEEYEPLNFSQIVNAAAGTDPLPFVPSENYRTRIDDISATNNDSIDHVVYFRFVADGGEVRAGSVMVPAGAGYDGVPAVSFFNNIFFSAAYFLFPTTQGLNVGVEVAMTGASEVHVLGRGGKV